LRFTRKTRLFARAKTLHKLLKVRYYLVSFPQLRKAALS
jgi:hypothetical protein